MAGPGVRVIDTGEAVAQQVVRVLECKDLFTPETRPGRETFYTSADAPEVERVVRMLLGKPDLRVNPAAV